MLSTVRDSLKTDQPDVTYLGVRGCTGVAGSRRIRGLGGQGSASSSTSRASVSIEERCWCCSNRRCLLLEDGVNRANESAWRTVACDSFHIPSLWSLVTSLVSESLDANGEAAWPMMPVPVMLTPVLKVAGQTAACNKAQLGNESSFGVCEILRGAEKNIVDVYGCDVNWISICYIAVNDLVVLRLLLRNTL